MKINFNNLKNYREFLYDPDDNKHRIFFDVSDIFKEKLGEDIVKKALMEVSQSTYMRYKEFIDKCYNSMIFKCHLCLEKEIRPVKFVLCFTNDKAIEMTAPINSIFINTNNGSDTDEYEFSYLG